MPTTDDLMCAALRGENPAWPGTNDAAPISAFLDRAAAHGVQALLHRCLAASDWPQALLRELRESAIALAIWELGHQQVLARTLVALDAIGVQPVLIKGTALAYALYSDPALRTRGDTDLVIPIEAKERVHEALTSLGFERSIGVSGEFVSYQASYTQRDPNGATHTLDLHWKINNSELLSRLFTYEELRRDAQPLPQLCPHALGTSRVHALLLACMHRATHRQNPYYVNGAPRHDANRLIWLYDIHLLAGGLSEREWRELVRLATEKKLRAICLEGMRRAQECFNSAYPDVVMGALGRAGVEDSARYFAGGKFQQQWMDFNAIGSHSQQLHFVRELLFPPAIYMRGKYPGVRSGWIPWLYLRRIVGGVFKRLARQSSGS